MKKIASAIVSLSAAAMAFQSHAPPVQFTPTPNPKNIAPDTERDTTISVKDEDTLQGGGLTNHTDYIFVEYGAINSGSHVWWGCTGTGPTYTYLHRKRSSNTAGTYTDYYKYKDTICVANFNDTGTNFETVSQLVTVGSADPGDPPGGGR